MMFGQKFQLTWQCRKDDLGVFISTIYQICQPIQSHALCHGWHSLTCQHALANMARRFNFANSMDIGEGKKCQQSNVTMCQSILFHPNQPHPNLLCRKDTIQPLPHRPSIHICEWNRGFSVIWTLVLKRKITQVTSYVWRWAEIARATVL